MHRKPLRAALLALLGAAPLAAQRTAAPAPGDSPDGEPVQRVLTSVAPAELARLLPDAGAALPVSGGPLSETFLTTGEAPEGDTPSGAAFTPNGAWLVIAHRTSRNLVVLDAATRSYLGQVALSGSPNDVAITSDGQYAVTANIWEDTASIVDLTTGVEVAVVPVGDQPGVVRTTPDGTRALVGNTVSQSLSVIDLASATELARIPGAGWVSIVRLTGEGGVYTVEFGQLEVVDDQTAIHTDFWSDRIVFFDLALGTATFVPCAADPRPVAVTPGGATAVVGHTGSARTVTVVDTATQTIVKTIPTGIDLWESIAVNPAGTRAVCSVLNAVVVVDLGTDAVSPTLNTASVNRLLTTADGLYALCVGFRGSLVDYATQTVVAELDNVVTPYVGAVSPAGPRAALIPNHNGEDLLFVRTNGAAGGLEGIVPSGAPPEADSTRMVAVSSDGRRAVTTNILSDTATVLDLETGLVEAIVPVGDRPAGVAIAPDGSRAVVANLDSTFVSVIDLGTFAVTSVSTSTRNSEVVISPDSGYAYVAVVVNDGVWRIDLDALAVAGPKLTTGNMGSVGYAFQQASGLALSHDGATLVACGSFSDTITLINAASWSVYTSVPVGDLPARALFSADDGRIFVTNRGSGTVSVVANAGAASAVTATIPVGTWPFEMAHRAADDVLFVASYVDEAVDVVDVGAGAQTATIPLPDAPQGLALSRDGRRLWVASGGWSLTIGPGPATSVSQAGFFTAIDALSLTATDELATGLPPAMLRADPFERFTLVASPFGDGLTKVDLGAAPGAPICFGDGSGAPCPCGNESTLPGAGCRHSGGAGMTIAASGSASVTADDLVMTAIGCPLGNTGVFCSGKALVNGGLGQPLYDGVQCAGGDVLRYQGVFQAGGVASDTGFGAQDPSGVYFVPGEAVVWQFWSRDVAAGPSPCGTSANFSPGYRVVMAP